MVSKLSKLISTFHCHSKISRFKRIKFFKLGLWGQFLLISSGLFSRCVSAQKLSPHSISELLDYEQSMTFLARLSSGLIHTRESDTGAGALSTRHYNYCPTVTVLVAATAQITIFILSLPWTHLRRSYCSTPIIIFNRVNEHNYAMLKNALHFCFER